MVVGQKPPIGVVAPNPGIAPEVEGAPASVPGGNDGTDKTKMTGTPATVAVAPPPISPDLPGGPNYVEADPSKIAVVPPPDNKEDAPSASTDVEQDPPADDSPKLTPEEQAKADAVAGTDSQIKTIQDWMDAEGNRPETEEQRKKRERREKSKKIIAAVSDGISALSNLFFTSQYAPNMYNHDKGSMMKPVNDRIEKLKAEREKNADKYLQFSLKLGDLQNERAKTLRELEAQQERQKLAREKAQREAEQHGWLALLQPDRQREQKGKADRAEQEAITAQAEAEAAPEMQRAKLATEKARKGSLDASAANSRASAAAHNRSNVSEFSAWDEHGHEHKFRTKDAAEAYAKQHGTWQEVDETETTDTSRTVGSRTSKSTSTKTKKGGHAGKPSPTGKQSPTA
ncbi:MAG: hypothetical protein J6C44_08715 [Muribaculaceae bacterium]|nr:hypothetical protein [Muribaculaceae bacterium]